jgi:hypothetical protein
MNMQDIPDSELDKLFRNSAKRYDTNFDENSWLLMDERLSARDTNRRFKRRLLAGALLFVFLFSSVTGYYLYNNLNNKEAAIADVSYSKTKKEKDEIKNNPSGNKNTETEKYPGKEKENMVNEKSAVIKKSTLSTITEDNSSSIADSGRKPGRSRKKANSIRDKDFVHEKKYPLESKKGVRNVSDNTTPIVSAMDKGDKQKEENVTGDILLAEARNKKALVENKNNLVGNDSLENDPAKNISTEQNSSKEIEKLSAIPFDSLAVDNNSKNSASDAFLAKAVVDSVVSDTTAKLPLIDTTSTSEAVKKNKEKPVKFRRYSIGLLASPDFSSVGLPKIGSPGVGEGLFIEYHLTPRWTIYTGVIKSFKKYSGDSSGYKSTEGFWQGKNKTKRIDGSCNIIDVPLNVKYHFLLRQKSLLFTSVGMSSYFMLNEQYSFIWTNNQKTWKYSSKENYFFSVVNISLGYEKLLSKSLSVQAEPYVKIPVKDIGEGDIKLFTAGLFLSLKYNIR